MLAASWVAVTHRFVVPSALVELLLAEQTRATLCSERLGLERETKQSSTGLTTAVYKKKKQTCETHSTTWSMILRANFPTLVPPNFCTTQSLLVLTGPPLTIDTGSESEGSRLSMLVNWTITSLWACNQDTCMGLEQRGNLFYVHRRDCESGEYPAITFFSFFLFGPRDIGAIMILNTTTSTT